MAMGDRKTRAALNDLLEVTRRVMLPVSQDGTFWCDAVETTKMVEWTLSVSEKRLLSIYKQPQFSFATSPHPNPNLQTTSQ